MANYRNSGNDGGSTMIMIVIAILVLVGGGFALWYFLGQSSSSSSPTIMNPTVSGPTVSTPTGGGESPEGGKIYGPIDDIGDDRKKVLGAYSIRHLYTKYSGPIFRVRRVSGGGQGQGEDIFQKTKGGPLVTRDDKELNDWLGTGKSGEVIIWYDQYKDERHITMRSGYPKIEQDTSQSGKGKYELVFKDTKIMFNNEESKPVNLSKYPDMKIVSNTDIFKGPMEDRIMDGTITDLYFLEGTMESTAIDMLETSKKKLYVLNPDPKVDSNSDTQLKVLLNQQEIQVTNKTKGNLNIYVNGNVLKTGLKPGRHVYPNESAVKPGAKIELGTAPDKIIARAQVLMESVRAKIRGDISVKSLYVSAIEPTGATVNVYVKAANGQWTAIKTGITKSTMSQSISVPGMQRESLYGVGPTPEVIVDEWSPRYEETN